MKKASPKSKVMSTGAGGFAKGGSGKMAGKTGANPEKPFVSGNMNGALSRSMAAGGKTKMFGKQAATPSKKGTSSPNNG